MEKGSLDEEKRVILGAVHRKVLWGTKDSSSITFTLKGSLFASMAP